MTYGNHDSPDRVTRKTRLERAGSRRKEVTDQDGAPSATETVSDIGSPYESTSDVRYSGESMDFGESGEELI